MHHRKLVTGASTSAAKMRGHATLLVRWVVWGLLLGALGGGLCGFSQNDGLIPINKNMWSPTFVLCMSSVATLSSACAATEGVSMLARHFSPPPVRFSRPLLCLR